MTALIRVSEVAARTGLSLRYWQRFIAGGNAPWAKSFPTGRQRIFLIDSQAFDAWWQSQLGEITPCQGTSPQVLTNRRARRSR